MYLRIKIKCQCGCCYEFDQYDSFTYPPSCPSCKTVPDNATLSNLYRILESAHNIPKEFDGKIKFSVKSRDSN